MPQINIMIGGEEVSALLDTGCELSILNEQLYNKSRLLGLDCLELPTQHLSLVSAFNERNKRIRKPALLEIQIGDSTVDQVVLPSPQLLTHWHTQTSLRRPGSLGPLTLRLLMSYIYMSYIYVIYIYIYMERLFLMFLDHTQRRSKVGRTPLDE